MHIFIGIAQFITFLTNVALGALVLVKNIHVRANRAFAIFALGTAGWIMSLYLTIFGIGDALIVGRLAFGFGSVMVAGLLWFTAEYPVRSPHYRRATIVAIILGTFFTLLSVSPYMIFTAEAREGLYIFGTFNPLPYMAWTLFYLGSIIYTIVRAWLGVRRSQHLVKRQYRILAVGLTVFFIGFLITNLLMPILANNFRYNAFGPMFTLFTLACVSYSMLSYRMFDVRLILKRGLAVTVAAAAMVGIILGTSYLLAQIITPQYATMAGVLIVILLYRPLQYGIDLVFSKIAARGSYIYEDAVMRVTHLASQHFELEPLQEQIVVAIQDFFRFRHATLATFVPNSKEILAIRTDGDEKAVLKAIPTLLSTVALYNDDVIESDELSWRINNDADPKTVKRDSRTLELMRASNISIIVPFYVKGTLISLLFCDEKQTREALTSTDRRLLDIARSSLAPAMANAARYVAMERLNAKLAEANRAKGDFIDVVSHQFRTPLTEIGWNAELLTENKEMPDFAKPELSAIGDAANKLTSTLRSVFDALEIESETTAYKRDKVALDQLVTETLEPFKHRFQDKKLELKTDIEAVGCPGDKEKLVTVLQILLENALDYTPAPGTVTVKVGKTGDRAQLEVSDTGIGMDRKEQAHIFEKFYRSKKAKSLHADGSGLGLFVTRAFVQGMKGKVNLESQTGKGTTVKIDLPLLV